jgi:hypothetical protein
MWLTLAAAAFFGLLMLITLVRAEKSVANGALTVLTLLAVGIAVAATIRGPAAQRDVSGEAPMASAPTAALPALSCLDDLAGDMVLGVCEKAVFATADSTAAAVSYVAGQISHLASYGDAATAAKIMTPELQALRRSIERDRYGIVAQVLQVRDHCSPTECAVFRSLTDNHQIITNMDEHLYEGLVGRHAAMWTALPQVTASTAPGMGALAAYPPSMPTGKPTTMDFPSSNSIPPVSIMSAEPARRESATAAAPAARPVPAPSQSPAPAARPVPAPAPSQSPAPAAAAPAAKKSAAKQPHPAPVVAQPAPAVAQPVPAVAQPAPAVAQPTLLSPKPSAPAASND